jgi:hypothetical protein
MTYEQLLIKFPNASLGFLAANASDGIPRHLAPRPPTPPQEAPRKGTGRTRGPSSFADAEAAAQRAEADYRASLAVVERYLRDGPLAKGEAEGGDQRKFLVRFTSYRVRLLDEDNLCEKYHCDLLRYCGLLRDDEPGQARIVTTQEKVRTKAEERTEVEISPIE